MANQPKPTAQHIASGWVVEGELGGGADFGVVHFQTKGHSMLTAAGLAAILGQLNTYYGGLTNLPQSVGAHVNLRNGTYGVANGDLSGQLTAINNILATAANVSGSAS